MTIEEFYKLINESKTKDSKPPLEVMPKHIYKIHRVQELTRALNDYANSDLLINYYDLMIQWSNELIERLETLKKY